MEFGRVADVSICDVTLPADHANTARVLASGRKKKVNTPQVYVGCAKWSRKEWVGTLYPKGAKDKDFVEHYARQFNSIELNTTFYKIYPPETISEWRNRVGKDFLFCPKFYQGITHVKQLRNAQEHTDAFYKSIIHFEDRLGACFLQLSDRFTPSRMELLVQYVSSLPQDVPLFVELRHPSWFISSQEYEELFSILKSLGFGLVITDTAGRRDCVHQRLTNKEVFIRFVGNYLHATDYSRIDAWVQRLKLWFAQGLERVYFFMHQHDERDTPELSIYFTEQMNKHCGLKLKVPVYYTDAQGKLF